jgi:hypothetical protein
MKTAIFFTLPIAINSALALPFNIFSRGSHTLTASPGVVNYYTDDSCKTLAGTVDIPVVLEGEQSYRYGPGNKPCLSAMFTSSGDLGEWELAGQLGQDPVGTGDNQLGNPKLNYCVSFGGGQVVLATGYLSMAGFDALMFKEAAHGG